MKSLFAITGLLSLFAFAVSAHADDGQPSPSTGGVMVITSSGTTAPGGTVQVFTSTGSQTTGVGVAQSGAFTFQATAGSGGKNAGDKGNKSKVIKIEDFRVGKIIEVSPDGKVEVKDFDEKMPPEMTKHLPQEVRDAMESIRARTEKMRAFHGNAKGGAGESTVHGKMKIVIEKDGKLSEYETEMVDPQTGGAKGTAAQVEQMSAEAKKILEAYRKKAMEVPTKEAERKAGDLNAKLDKILDRLDRIEADVKSLKDHEKK